MPRHKDMQWNLPEGTLQRDGSRTHCWESIHAAILMDIRDELYKANHHLSVLSCRNFLEIPKTLKKIEVQTKKRTYTRKQV